MSFLLIRLIMNISKCKRYEVIYFSICNLRLSLFISCVCVCFYINLKISVYANMEIFQFGYIQIYTNIGVSRVIHGCAYSYKSPRYVISHAYQCTCCRVGTVFLATQHLSERRKQTNPIISTASTVNPATAPITSGICGEWRKILFFCVCYNFSNVSHIS